MSIGSSWNKLGYKNTNDLYRELHLKMKNTYISNMNIEIEKENANFLEQFLFNLKNIDKGATHPIEALANIDYLELAEKATSKMPNAKATHKLFRRAHDRNQKLIDGADDIFEQELNAVIQAFEKMSLRTDIPVNVSTSNTLVGQQTANVIDKIVEITLTESQKAIIANANKSKSELYDGPVFRAGKVDLQGAYAEIDIEAYVKPEFQRFAKLLQDATISAKNYSSQYWDKGQKQKIDKDIVALHLGSSDVFKSFVGGMSSLGYPTDVILKAFFAGYNVYTKHSNKDIGHHIYHMRFLYELRGAGLYDKEGNNLKEVKYLIWNDPSTDNIKVFSTAVIIQSLLQGDITTNENPFGGIYLRYSR